MVMDNRTVPTDFGENVTEAAQNDTNGNHDEEQDISASDVMSTFYIIISVVGESFELFSNCNFSVSVVVQQTVFWSCL